jgi:hypothetical protein
MYQLFGELRQHTEEYQNVWHLQQICPETFVEPNLKKTQNFNI